MAEYQEQAGRTYKIADDGERTQLANFTAKIQEETRYLDGDQVDSILKIEGWQADENGDLASLGMATVTAANFPSMAWVMTAWGVRCVLSPGSGTKEDMRAAIQTASKPKTSTVYKKIGWQDIGGKRNYLHNGGAISAAGNNPSVSTQLPPELSRYNLAVDPKIRVGDAIAATLALQYLGPPEVMWPLIAACFAPLYGPVDYAMHVTGRTGTYKSELCSLMQSHYGADMDARHLPASWSSTANAIEALAYYAANALMVLDDFVPTGTSWQIRAYHTTADKIIRAQGNQAGRSRLTDTSSLQTTMYPRGMILSTGEDTPEGHSVRARMLIMELSPGDIDATSLTKAQNNRQFYPVTTAALIRSLAEKPADLRARANEVRNANLTVGHTRTPSMLGNLVASIEYFLAWATAGKVITPQRRDATIKEATQALLDAANRQAYYLESADPCDVLMATLRHVLAAGLGHMRTLQGGVPGQADLLGWTNEGGGGEYDPPMFRSHGPCIGWVNWDQGELYLDANIGFTVLKKAAGSGSELAATKQTIFKRMKDGGFLTRCDETRQRNTVRITAEGHNRQVLALGITSALDQSEGAKDDPKAAEVTGSIPSIGSDSNEPAAAPEPAAPKPNKTKRATPAKGAKK